jgi:hypothetical protein
MCAAPAFPTSTLIAPWTNFSLIADDGTVNECDKSKNSILLKTREIRGPA